MDVKSAFQNGTLEEEVYVDQPPGYEKKHEEMKVCRLKKALYGLKQAPRAWYKKIDAYFEESDFHKSPYEHTLYVKKSPQGEILIACLYVDDLIFTGSSVEMYKDFKMTMMHKFEMTDMGLLHFFLGIEVNQNDDGIFISQKKYAKELLKRFSMEDAKPISTPMEVGLKLSKFDGKKVVHPTLYRSLVGGLVYLTTTRPNLTYAASMLSHFMESPRDAYWEVGKRILRYVKGSQSHGLHYYKNENPSLVGFCDSDWARSVDDCKSTLGYVFNIGSSAVSWSSKKQSVVAILTAEAEYIALAATSCQARWLRWILEELNHEQGAIKLFCDNKSDISLSKNPVFHGKSEHIKIKYHFIRELAKDKEVEVNYCKSQDQVADLFTKPLKKDLFIKMKTLLGVREI
eukprot:TRINITY_DN13467_c1_g2_i1.p1 TRINITY_DN13467_c1_g2~~TRINITY_DN13467_c1_g2_i1.p1  ORF type:complete len:401 (+),score=79.48 TRINITY_DN13467_c1_g2_i1:1121-2323(+)